MGKFSRLVFASLAALLLAGSMTGCFPEEYRDNRGRAYRHERWHGEHVYLREDGHWHARRNGEWVVVEDARF
jgi:hypothetical protein